MSEQTGSNPEQGDTAYKVHDLEEVYEDFLGYCREIPDKALALLEKMGIDDKTVRDFGLKYYFHGYRKATLRLQKKYGARMLRAAGMLVDRTEPDLRTGLPVTKPVGVFEPYRAASIPYVVIPYREHGHITYLKARSIGDRRKMKQHNLRYSIGTAKFSPTLLNIDHARESKHVLFLHEDLDVLAAATKNLPAVGYNTLSAFRREWVDAMKGKHVVLVVEDIRRNDDRVKLVQKLFKQQKVDKPEVLLIPEGTSGGDLMSFLHESLSAVKMAGDDWSGALAPEDIVGMSGLALIEDADDSGGADAAPADVVEALDQMFNDDGFNDDDFDDDDEDEIDAQFL